jgi:23S rRNA (cytidine1920-2'-O)/16S rRNA (cytidine1409-2'-O)-methyltransferase
MRLDQALVARGLVPSREKAQAAVLAGAVQLNGAPAQKSSRQVSESDVLALAESDATRYVGRGSRKLLHALEHFSIPVEGLVCLDAGASTGGFTQVLLARGAARVFAVDVGSGQLAPSLQSDPRVVNLERTDLRAAQLPGQFGFACADVSFISLRLILPRLYEQLAPNAMAVCLLKPQFEAGRAQVGKGGVVKSKAAHRQVLEDICAFAAQTGFALRGAVHSPIKGGSGNMEYLLALRKGGGSAWHAGQAASIVEAAWNILGA